MVARAMRMIHEHVRAHAHAGTSSRKPAVSSFDQ